MSESTTPPGVARALTSYPGSKNGAGVWQKIINQQPPHSTYIEPFLGSGAVFWRKRPAVLNIGVDLSEQVIRAAEASGAVVVYDCRRPETIPATLPAAQLEAATSAEEDALSCPGNRFTLPELAQSSSSPVVIQGCAISFLSSYPFTGSELIYCDPPYLLSGSRSYYRHPFQEADHGRLLSLLIDLPCRVQLSGYRNPLYERMLARWRTIDFKAMSRGGPRTETLWMNYDEPEELHDYRFVGENKMQRQAFKRQRERWQRRLREMPAAKRYALLAALQSDQK